MGCPCCGPCGDPHPQPCLESGVAAWLPGAVARALDVQGLLRARAQKCPGPPTRPGASLTSPERRPLSWSPDLADFASSTCSLPGPCCASRACLLVTEDGEAPSHGAACPRRETQGSRPRSLRGRPFCHLPLLLCHCRPGPLPPASSQGLPAAATVAFHIRLVRRRAPLLLPQPPAPGMTFIPAWPRPHPPPHSRALLPAACSVHTEPHAPCGPPCPAAPPSSVPRAPHASACAGGTCSVVWLDPSSSVRPSVRRPRDVRVASTCGRCESCCCDISSHPSFRFLWACAWEWNCWVMW